MLEFANDLGSMTVSLATQEDIDLYPVYSYSLFNSVERCPFRGILSAKGKTLQDPETMVKAMPLQAGGACHRGFAAARIKDMYEQGHTELALDAHDKQFGKDGDDFLAMLKEVDGPVERRNYVLQALYTSGYIDDPRDRNRTLSNMMVSLSNYCDEWPWGRLQVATLPNQTELANRVKYPKYELAIEYRFNLLVDIVGMGKYILKGICDGIHSKRIGSNTIRLTASENKTASKITDDWVLGQHMSYQLTTYAIAAQIIATHLNEIQSNYEYLADDRVQLLAMSIPMPKGYGQNIAYLNEYITRYNSHLRDWAKWVIQQIKYIDRYINSPLSAPRNTHTCYEFFRVCPLIPFCDTNESERKLIYEQLFTLPQLKNSNDDLED